MTFLLLGLLEAHVEHIDFFLDSLVQAEDVVVLVLLVQNAVDTQQLLIHLAESFNFLCMLLTVRFLGTRLSASSAHHPGPLEWTGILPLRVNFLIRLLRAGS